MKLRYREPVGPEAQFQLGSRGRVLANLQGITSRREMDRAEYEALVSAQKLYYRTLTAKTRFTAALLRDMHREWLGHLYAWAGQYRTVELRKGEFGWPPARRIPENMERFEWETLSACTPCRPGPLVEVTLAMARVHADFLLIHPFRDGNGRLARWIADLMAVQANYPVPDYALSGRGSKARQEHYVAAVGQGYLRNYEPLAAFFAEAVRRGERPPMGRP